MTKYKCTINCTYFYDTYFNCAFIFKRDSVDSYLLVGAPLDSDPSSGLRDGVLWRCPLTSRKDDCR